MPSVDIEHKIGLCLVKIGIVDLKMFFLDVIVRVEKSWSRGISFCDFLCDELIDSQRVFVVLA